MSTNRLILLIMAAVFTWGVLHAVGAYLLNHNPWRPIMVLSCVLAFLGFWALMLRTRRRPADHENYEQNV